MKEEIILKLEELTDLCADNSLKHHHYSDKDLFHALLVFNHFFFDVIYSENKYLDHQGKCILAINAGVDVRALIFNYTGRDVSKIVKKLTN